MTIICVDASPVELARLWWQLRKIQPDAEVRCCRSAKETLETARKIKTERMSAKDSGLTNCDVLITDVDLGGTKGEGLRLAEEVKKLYPYVNIIFTISSLGRDYAGQILKLRASGYLTKPFSLDELREELCHLRYTLTTDAGGVFL